MERRPPGASPPCLRATGLHRLGRGLRRSRGVKDSLLRPLARAGQPAAVLDYITLLDTHHRHIHEERAPFVSRCVVAGVSAGRAQPDAQHAHPPGARGPRQSRRPHGLPRRAAPPHGRPYGTYGRAHGRSYGHGRPHGTYGWSHGRAHGSHGLYGPSRHGRPRRDVHGADGGPQLPRPLRHCVQDGQLRQRSGE